MKYTIDLWLPYKDMMQRIAADYQRKYPMVERDDLEQEMYLWFVSHPKKFKEWLEFEEKDRDKLIAKSLRNQCLKYCEREKARKQGYDITDLYYYDISVVEAFLPTIINEIYEMPAKIKDLNNKFSGGEISDGMNWLALRSDIASSYYKLNEAKQNILRLRYSIGEQPDWQKLGEELKTSADGARMKVQRILNNIVQNLGGWKPYYDEDTTQEESGGEATEQSSAEHDEE
jgi:DNA-directed RNA polymerase specialized sigma24 family protein